MIINTGAITAMCVASMVAMQNMRRDAERREEEEKRRKHFVEMERKEKEQREKEGNNPSFFCSFCLLTNAAWGGIIAGRAQLRRSLFGIK